MLIYLDDRRAELLLTLLNKYKDNLILSDVRKQVVAGLERDYGKRVD